MVRATEHDPVTPLPTLDYGRPDPRPSRSHMIWGIVISVFLANGVGWTSFGMLMIMGQRDDEAGPVAIGLASIALALSLAAALYLRQRFPRETR